MNNSRNNINNVYSFKKVIDDIINANLANKGMVKYVSAKVVGVNSNGTVNVYIPPDNSNIVNGLANKSGEILATGDSVELCTKNGSLKNAWIAVKHGINSAVGATDNFPIGSIIAYGGTEIPDNWLICDGAELDRTAYNELFKNIGTAYGEGDGSTTFNIPNMRGKIGVGLDSTDQYFSDLGKSGGSKFHNHNYKIGWYGYYSSVANIDEDALATYDYQKQKWNYYGASTNGMKNSTSVNSGLTGSAKNMSCIKYASESSTSNNSNIQPYTTVNYIIKVSNKISFIDTKQAQVINNLTSTSITDALSANMGKVLDEKFNSLATQLSILSYDFKNDGVPVLTGRFFNGKPEYIVGITVPNLIQGTTTAKIPFTISQVDVTEIGGTVISNTNNVFSLDTANFNAGCNYVYLNYSLNKLAVQCQNVNYKTAYVNIKYVMKGEE